MRVTIEDQIRGVEDCVADARTVGFSALDHARAAVRTLKWLAENRELFREFAALEKTDLVQELKRTFPGGQIKAIRRAE